MKKNLPKIKKMSIWYSKILELGQKKVVKDSWIFVAFNVLNRSIPFIFIPLFTRYIDPAGYGLIAIFTLIVTFLTPLIGLSSNTVLYQLYFKFSKHDVAQFVNDSYKLILLITFLILAGVASFPTAIRELFGLGPLWLGMAVLSAGSGMVATITSSLFLIRKQARNYGLFQFSVILLNVVITVILLVHMNLSWQGRVIAITSAAFLSACFAILVNNRHNDFRFSDFRRVTQLKTISHLGFALVPNAIGGFMILMIDRVMLASFSTLETLGIYAIGVLVAQITDVLLASISRALQPYLYENGSLRTARNDLQTVQLFCGYIVISGIIAALVTLLSPFIFKVMIDDRYNEALSLIALLSVSNAFFNIGGLFLSLILIAKKNWITAYISGVCVIFGLAASYWGVSAIGMRGAAIANVLTGLVYMSLTVFFALKYYKIQWIPR